MTNQDDTGIERTLADWKTAVHTADLDEIVQLVTEDAEFWSHGAPVLEGREAVRRAFRPFFASYEMEQEFRLRERIVSGDYAFLRGLEVNRLTPKAGGDTTEVKQRAFSLLHREPDGRWRFARGMTNLPPAEGE